MGPGERSSLARSCLISWTMAASPGAAAGAAAVEVGAAGAVAGGVPCVVVPPEVEAVGVVVSGSAPGK